MKWATFQCPALLLQQRRLQRHCRAMALSRVWRWLLYAIIVSVLVTWTYLAHPYRLLDDDTPAITKNAVQPRAPRISNSMTLDVKDSVQTPAEVPDNSIYIAITGREDNSIAHDRKQLLGISQEVIGANDRYNQIIIEQTEDKLWNNSVEKIGSSSEPLDENEMELIGRRLEGRRIRVKRTCGRHGLGRYHHPGLSSSGTRLRYPPTANYDVLYIDRQDGLTWCPVYKAASTSWLHNLCLLAGVKKSLLQTTKEQISSIARSVWPSLEYEDAQQAVPQTTTFMIVRHPFERLVSAYRDKLENLNIGQEHGVQHFYEAYGKKIVQKYRTEASNNNRTRVSLSASPDAPKPQGIEPTFYEFVKFLLDSDLVHHSDDHWMPYYLFCTPCYINYDVIAKFETLESDQKYLLQKLNLDSKISQKWLHLTKGQKSADIVKKYFNTISKSDVKKLFQKYKLDFEMYDYTINDYL